VVCRIFGRTIGTARLLAAYRALQALLAGAKLAR
jgi:hypothetical protein